MTINSDEWVMVRLTCPPWRFNDMKVGTWSWRHWSPGRNSRLCDWSCKTGDWIGQLSDMKDRLVAPSDLTWFGQFPDVLFGFDSVIRRYKDVRWRHVVFEDSKLICYRVSWWLLPVSVRGINFVTICLLQSSWQFETHPIYSLLFLSILFTSYFDARQMLLTGSTIAQPTGLSSKAVSSTMSRSVGT